MRRKLYRPSPSLSPPLFSPSPPGRGPRLSLPPLLSMASSRRARWRRESDAAAPRSPPPPPSSSPSSPPSLSPSSSPAPWPCRLPGGHTSRAHEWSSRCAHARARPPRSLPYLTALMQASKVSTHHLHTHSRTHTLTHSHTGHTMTHSRAPHMQPDAARASATPRPTCAAVCAPRCPGGSALRHCCVSAGVTAPGTR